MEPPRPTPAAIALAAAGLALIAVTTCDVQRLIAVAPPSRWTVAAYLALTAAAFAIFLRVLQWTRDPRLQPGGILALLLLPVPIWLALSQAAPAMSIDVWSYLGHGALVNAGDNPYVTPVKALADREYGRELASRGWLPVHGVSPYGPLWTRVEQLADGVASGVETRMRIVKAVVAVGALWCGYLIWRVLGTIRSPYRLLGTALFLWNPLLLVELGAEGHNDALAIAFALAAVLLFVQRRTGQGVLALTASAAVKITTLTIAPSLAALAWRDRRSAWRRLLPMAAAALVALGLAALLFGDLWVGRTTLAGVREHGLARVAPSTTGLLLVVLGSDAAGGRADALLPAIGLAVLGLFTLWSVSRVTDRASALRSTGEVALAALVLGPSYWPWYAATAVALLALSPGPAHVAAIVLFSVCGRLAAPLDRLRLNGAMDWPTEAVVTTLVGLWLPVTVLVLSALWRRTRQPDAAYAAVHP
ncbi:MAG: hypothetical protein AB7O32_17460 [Vicinamibacterales bacterium]